MVSCPKCGKILHYKALYKGLYLPLSHEECGISYWKDVNKFTLWFGNGEQVYFNFTRSQIEHYLKMTAFL